MSARNENRGCILHQEDTRSILRWECGTLFPRAGNLAAFKYPGFFRTAVVLCVSHESEYLRVSSPVRPDPFIERVRVLLFVMGRAKKSTIYGGGSSRGDPVTIRGLASVSRSWICLVAEDGAGAATLAAAVHDFFAGGVIVDNTDSRPVRPVNS